MTDINTPTKVAQFNPAMMNAMRIAGNLHEANQCCFHGDLAGWQNILVILFREVCPKLRQSEIKEGHDILGKVMPVAGQYNQAQASHNEVLAHRVSGQYYFVLHNFDIWVRTKLDEHGLGNPDQADAGVAIGRG